MNLSPLRSLAVLGLASLIALAPATAPAAQKAPAKPRPVVQFDPTPVGAKAGLVTSYADVVEPVQKAVVSIDITKIVTERLGNPLFRQLFPGMPEPERQDEQKGLGSGVIVSKDGYILTNNHVVADADLLKVQLADGREYTATLIGADPKTDIAVIKIEAENLPTATLADSDKIRVGDVVFAVGNPLGVGQTVTMGIVSAKNRNAKILEDVGGYEDFIQTDAAINMGNSGGALIDARGRLIGINSAIISPSRGHVGIGFAVPVNLAASIMNSLVETGSVARGYLGITADDVTPDVAAQLELPRDTRGVLVTDIDPDSPAEKAGLKRFDVISGFNDHAITNYSELRLLIAQLAPGTEIRIKILRDGRERTLAVTLESIAEKANELLPGVEVAPLTADDRRRVGIVDRRVTGLIVTKVDDTSPYRGRLVPDTVIVEIKRQTVGEVAAARQLLEPGFNLVTVYTPRAGFRILNLEVKPE